MMMRFKVVKDLAQCKTIWNAFSPNESLFDDWNYRSCFFNPEVHEPHFIIGIEDGVPVGVLPLWRVKSSDFYEWFGGEFPENNKVFFKPEHSKSFLRKLPREFWLPYVDTMYANLLGAKQGESSYYLRLDNYEYSLDNYLSRFGKKHRKNLKRDIRILQEHGTQVVLNDLNCFDRMCELNIERFADESFLLEPSFRLSVKKLLETALQRGELEMISILLDGRLEAVEAAIFHKGTYTVLLGGSNLKVSNIGKLLTIEHIKNAMRLKANIIDFLSHDCGWKKLWNMEEKIWCELSREKSKQILAAPLINQQNFDR